MSTIKSRLYNCEVFHSRKEPQVNQFTYRYSTFCLDLDEVELLSQKSFLFGLGWAKPYRFVAEDSIFGDKAESPRDLKTSIIQYALKKGNTSPVSRVEYLGHVRTLGYSYNPASFFFGYGVHDELLFAIVEVTNTFREKKSYFISAKASQPAALAKHQTAVGANAEAEREVEGEAAKYFYVSPFSELESLFEFHLRRPDKKLSIRIDSAKATANGERATIVTAVMKGIAVSFTEWSLLQSLVRFPLVTLSVMAKIHFQTGKLYLKGVPFIKKSHRPDLQRGGIS